MQIMFSKAEEYLEHCVHVCKAAVIDLAEPLLTQCCLMTGYGWDGDASPSWCWLSTLQSFGVLIDNASMCFGIPPIIHIHLPKYHILCVFSGECTETGDEADELPSIE